MAQLILKQCHKVSLLVAFLQPLAAAFGQTYSLNNPSASGMPAGAVQVEIGFSKPGPHGKPNLPSEQIIRAKNSWRVTVFRKGEQQSATEEQLDVISATPTSLYAATGIVQLQTSARGSLDPTVDKAILGVEIHFLYGDSVPAAVLGPKPNPSEPTPTKTGGSGGKSGCGNAVPEELIGDTYVDFCLSGIWVPQIGSHPLYSTNSNISIAHQLWDGSMGLSAQEAADSSVVLDPNSFNAALFYQKVLSTHGPASTHSMGTILNWKYLTTEFDRKKKNTNLGTNVNLVTSPQLLFPFDLGKGVGFEIDLGIETGHNFKNNIDPNGFGTIFRGVPGAQIEKIFQHPPKPLKSAKFTSLYQARILAEPEVLTRSIHGKLVPFEGTQTRHYISTEFDLMVTNNFGVTLKYDYGALPPGFVFIQSRATIGLTVQSSPKSK